jgi:hypothetical protein
VNKAEYAEYEAAVAAFFEREGISNLTGGHITCPDCNIEFDDAGICPECGADREIVNEPFFSWRPCDCCGRPLGGDREHATGWNATTEEIQEYTVCTDCIYYAEYGRLDDTTMMEVEKSTE